MKLIALASPDCASARAATMPTGTLGSPIARPSARSAFTSVVRSATACAARRRTASEGSLSNASSSN